MYLSAYASQIDDGIKHLEGLSGNATLGHQEGGGWCFRYSCSWASGIYGCNDNQFDVEVPWSTLAAYASTPLCLPHPLVCLHPDVPVLLLISGLKVILTATCLIEDINNNCSWVTRGARISSTTWVRGQAFDSGGWNVIVGLKDNEDC